ncbi:hypothetical protein HWC80_gp067 [Mycobacterium phage Indlulamithi]|uniref:Uncharacterized protein n=1 Tax=Mycobacterium phage Indlulamithi TaxID=2656582 RepID=A0A649VD62_9CAUD|nr:hypothetical protein HWC80_gp067 [Mycobacterium phage Indlulamithi]QGJ90144.1 hypothetical protein PBI_INDLULAMITHI_107 [Mycobacterium phage Indlulamithi]
MTVKEYARWHRLASENLMDAAIAMEDEGQAHKAAEHIRAAEEYAKLAFDHVSGEFTRALNQGITGSIAFLKMMVESGRLSKRADDVAAQDN